MSLHLSTLYPKWRAYSAILRILCQYVSSCTPTTRMLLLGLAFGWLAAELKTDLWPVGELFVNNIFNYLENEFGITRANILTYITRIILSCLYIFITCMIIYITHLGFNLWVIRHKLSKSTFILVMLAIVVTMWIYNLPNLVASILDIDTDIIKPNNMYIRNDWFVLNQIKYHTLCTYTKSTYSDYKNAYVCVPMPGC